MNKIIYRIPQRGIKCQIPYSTYVVYGISKNKPKSKQKSSKRTFSKQLNLAHLAMR